MHILADSDQEADQTVKLQVRDAVLEVISQDLTGDCTLEGTVACLEGELGQIEQTANHVLEEAGMPYRARAELTEMYFTTRDYIRNGQAFSMPAGRYKALRITLGSGEGHNWWCVMFPDLCVTKDDKVRINNTARKKMEKLLGKKTIRKITKDKYLGWLFKV